MHPIQGFPSAAGEEARDRLVCEDHQLLDERMGLGLPLLRGPRNPALAVEPELDLRALDP